MSSFPWMPFYGAIAKALGEYATERPRLFQKVKKLAASTPLMSYLHFENGPLWADRDNEIDPFTVMGIFNRATTVEHRAKLARLVAAMLDVALEPPREYHGIAHLDPRKSIYNGNAQMWELFLAAPGRDGAFKAAYTRAKNISGNALGTLSIALFWVNPPLYMPVDKISAPFIEKRFGLPAPAEKCDGDAYVSWLDALDERLGSQKSGTSYAEIALDAWKSVHAS